MKKHSWQLAVGSWQRRKGIASSSRRGFTLLLAAIISSVVLALAASIFTIVQKQITLSSMGRDSQFAFYAADSAADCALYWDIRGSIVTPFFSTTTPPASISCGGVSTSVSATPPDLSGNWTSSDFTYQYDPNSYCAIVTVTKSYDAPSDSVRTIIHADGFNTNCANVGTSPRALQRSVELNY